jgi:hypothetical protein
MKGERVCAEAGSRDHRLQDLFATGSHEQPICKNRVVGRMDLSLFFFLPFFKLLFSSSKDPVVKSLVAARSELGFSFLVLIKDP